MNRRKKRTTKARSNQSPQLPNNSPLRNSFSDLAPGTRAKPPAPTLSNKPIVALQPSDLEQMMMALYGSDEDRSEVAIRIQPQLVRNRREYALAKDLALAGDIKRLREILGEFARHLAKDSLRFWLDYFGVKPSKGGAPKKELFTDRKAYPVGHAVEETIERFRPLFKLKQQLGAADLQKQLAESRISSADIDCILKSRNPSAAACKSVSLRADLKLKTVRNYHLQFQRKSPKN